MATNTEIPVSSTDLSNEGFSTLASKAFDDKLNVKKCYDTPAALKELESLKTKTEAGEVSITGVTTTLLNDLINECKKASVAQPPKPASSAPTNNQDYKKGPLKAETDPNTPFQNVSENQDVRLMAEAVKSNINLMQTSVRKHWGRHFDDALLGSTLDFNQEYEHFGRMLTDAVGRTGLPIWFVAVTDKDNAGNIVTRSQSGAADIIDNLVAQYGNGKNELTSTGLLSQSKIFANTADRDTEIKKMLVEMNESVKAEDDWMLTLFGLYLASKVSLPLVGGILKWTLKLASIKGKGGVQLVALGAELYEKVDRRMKGADPANKTLWDSVKDRIKGDKLAGAKDADLTTEQKDLRKSQTEGIKNVLRDYLFDKYGKGMIRADFDKAVDGNMGSSAKNIADARRAQSEIMEKLSRHVPIDFSPGANDAYEIDQRMRAMALDMEPSVWVKMRTGLYRFFFEKGGITNLVFQNKLVDLSNRVGMGSYSKPVRTHADALRTSLDTVSVDIGDGQKIDVSRVDEERVKELIKHIDADVALAAQDAEMKALADVQKIQGEINILKADGIPDGEQEVAEKIRQLEEAKMKYTDFEKLHNLAQSARTERKNADDAIKDKQGELETAQDKLANAKNRIQLYNEYYPLKRAHEEVELKKQSAATKLNQEKLQVDSTIKTLEGTLKSNGIASFADFSTSTTDADFLDKARSHVRVLQAQVTAYNTSAQKGSKLDINATFSGVNSDILNTGKAYDAFVALELSESAKKAELQTKIAELSSAGIWDMGNNSISKTLPELQQEEKAALQEEKTAQKNVADAQEKLTKVLAGVDKIKANIKNNSSREVINKGTVRNADGTVLSRDILTKADIDEKLAKAKEMAAKQVEKGNATQKVNTTQGARAQVVTKAGVTTDVKPNTDGTHSTGSKNFFDRMTAQQAEVQTTYTEYVRRAAAKGYTLEIKDGKATLTDAAGKKLEFDMTKPEERVKLLRKI